MPDEPSFINTKVSDTEAPEEIPHEGVLTIFAAIVLDILLNDAKVPKQ